MPFYLVDPSALTNIATNPSFELGATTGWTAVGGSVTAASGFAYKGVYAGLVTVTATTTNGCYYTFNSGSNTNFSAVFYIYCEQGVPFKAYFANTSAVQQGTATTFTGVGQDSTGAGLGNSRWQRVDVSVNNLSTSTSYRLYITKNGSASTASFYVDALCINSGGTGMIFTYFDGDDDDCYWRGARHASESRVFTYISSYGQMINVSDYSIYHLAQSGTGTPPIQNNSTPYSAVDGSLYEGQRVPERSFTITFQVNPDTGISDPVEGWHKTRARLIDFVRSNESVSNQPRRIFYTDGPDEMYIDAVYDGGLELQDGTKEIEVVSLRFIAYDPYWYSSRRSGGTVTGTASLTNSNRIVWKGQYNPWTRVGTGATPGAVFSLTEGTDHSIYLGGSFTSVNSVSNTSKIAKLDLSSGSGTYTALGTGCTGGEVYAIAVAPNGDLIVGGSFTSAGGVANTNGLALWNGSSWSSIGTLAGGGSDCYAITYDTLGNLVITGDFTSVGGTAAVNIASRSTAGTWSAYGSGIGSSGLALAVAQDNTVYVAGGFSTANGGVTTVNCVTYWNGSAWAQMGPASSPGLTGAANTSGWHLIFAPDGRLIVSGPFRTAGGVSCNHVAAWNGVSFTPFGSGVGYNGTAALADSTGITSSFFFPDGTWFAGGQFGNPTTSFTNPTAGGLIFPDSLALWTGSSWVYPDIDLPGAAKISACLYSTNKTIFLGFDTSGSSESIHFGSSTSSGDVDFYPIITFTATVAGNIYRIEDEYGIYKIFLNTTISVGETITLDLRPGRKTITSSVAGNIISRVLPGSSLSTFKLRARSGGIWVFCSSSNVTASVIGQSKYWSIDGGLA